MFKTKAGLNLLSREREMLRMISVLKGAEPEFIVVGGYAVATMMHRFSVDLDIVIMKRDAATFESALKGSGYSPAYSKDIGRIYGEEFRRFEKSVEGFPVDVDLLINGLVSRKTDASWSFEYIMKNSVKGKLNGTEFLMPSRELLIAMKLHSGRFSDVRDVAAMAEGSDLSKIKRHALRGDRTKLKETIAMGLKILESINFPDSFKGIFGARFFSQESMENAKDLMKSIRKSLATDRKITRLAR